MQASNDNDPDSTDAHQPSNQSSGWLMAIGIIAISVLLCSLLWLNLSSKGATQKAEPEATTTENTNTVELNPKNLNQVELATVTTRRPTASFSVVATVEPNQEQLQQITPLVAGRVQKIYVALGDHVTAGTLLVRIDSPQVAELHGKLHEAETRFTLAKLTLNRVQQSANRVNILKAKASLCEAESNLKRTQQLVAERLTPKKDLVAAQADYERDKADYNFEKDISLNKEVAEAKAEYTMAATEAEHIKDGLRALDARFPKAGEGGEHDISTIELHSPISGVVIERFVNPGAGFEQGKPLLTIANTSNLWVIANVPEKQIARVHIGSRARITVNQRTLTGTVSYVDPRLNEDTRTARVRIEIKNPGDKIQVGSFAQVEFEEPSNAEAELYVPEAAVQTVDGHPVVFVKGSSGQFAVRKVTVSSAVSGMIPVISGLKANEKVATNGSFLLKSKLLKEQFGDDD